MLYIVATPIGNLEDITLRALRILREVDIILCEDTRVTQKLLSHYKIYPVKSPTSRRGAKQFNRVDGKKLISYHQHSSDKKVNQLTGLISNQEVALVTDAGTPGISDPGNKLIAKIVGTRRGVFSSITAIPGPSALITALSISGMPTDRFLFKGFVPHKKGREKFLREAMESKITTVFYESPYRIIKCLEQLNNLCRNRALPCSKQLVVCRELTKKFETIYRGDAGEILEQIKKDFPEGNPKGEFVVVAG